MTFGEKLRLLREERGMTLSEFGKLLGTSKQVISRYERDENTPKITTVQQWASKLNVTLEYLTDDGTAPAEPKPSGIRAEAEALIRSLSDEELKRLIQLMEIAFPEAAARAKEKAGL